MISNSVSTVWWNYTNLEGIVYYIQEYLVYHVYYVIDSNVITQHIIVFILTINIWKIMNVSINICVLMTLSKHWHKYRSEWYKYLFFINALISYIYKHFLQLCGMYFKFLFYAFFIIFACYLDKALFWMSYWFEVHSIA